MKRFLSIIILLFTVTMVFAQEITVTSMDLLSNDLTARVNSRKDLNGNYCALIKVQLPVEGLQFEGNVIGKADYHVNEYYVYMTAGSKGLMIRHPKYQLLVVNFPDYGISSVESRTTYGLKLKADQLITERVIFDTVMVVDTIKVHTPVSVAANNNISYEISDEGVLTIKDIPIIKRPYSVYVEGKFQAGSMMGFGGGLGAYLGQFNIEGYAVISLSESKEVFWIPSSSTHTAYSYTYKASSFGAKIGYGIPLSEKFRLTPQVAAGIVSVSGSEKRSGTGNDPKATDAYAIPVAAGLRVEILFSNHFGLSLTPEYSFAVSKSDAFTRISDVCSDVKGFGNGFNAKIGAFICF